MKNYESLTPLDSSWWVVYDYSGAHVGTVCYVQHPAHGFVHNTIRKTQHKFIVRKFNSEL